MLAQALREQVCRANLDLVDRGLVMGTFGNVSGVDRAAGLFVIKASGVPYATLAPEHMVPISLETGAVTGRPVAPFFGHADPSRAVPRLRVRRHRAHAFGFCDGVRAGAHTGAVHGDDACRLLSR